MKKLIVVLVGYFMVCGLHANCSTMSQEVRMFAERLTPQNQVMFCEVFSEAQKASAIQMASTPDASGFKMTPDMAVQKVAAIKAPSTIEQKTPASCPK